MEWQLVAELAIGHWAITWHTERFGSAWLGYRDEAKASPTN